MAFWKRNKESEYISLGLNRAATAEEEAIAAKRDEGPEPEFFEKFAEAVASTRENLAGRIDSVIGARREIDADVLDELEEALIGADIGAQTSLAIIEKARQQVIANSLAMSMKLKRLIKSELRDILDTAERNRQRGTVASETEVRLDIKPYIMMIVGVNGVGKTTTIASSRIASRAKAMRY